jgi:hypothetical protein
MSSTTVRANAQGFSETQHSYAAAARGNDWATKAYQNLEGDIYDLVRMLRGADYLHHSGGEDMKDTATLLYNTALAMAEDLDRTYHKRLKNDDPVLTLVAKARAAWDRLGEVLNETETGEGKRVDEAHRVLDAANAELLETPPTTLAGARAAIAWLVECDKENIPEKSGAYLRTLIRSPIFAQEEARS